MHKWGLSIAVSVYALLHFITYFFENEVLLLVLMFSGLALFAFALVNYKISRFKLPLTLFLSGFIIFLISDTELLYGFTGGLLQMSNVIGLLIVVPMISWVLKEEFYMEAIVVFGHKLLDSSRKFYAGMVTFTQIIAYFLLFGAIPMMYQFVTMILKDEKGEAWEKFKGTALLRGFALSTLWVISIPSFVFVVDVMEASLFISILQGMLMAGIGVVLAVIFSFFEEKRSGVDLTAGLQSEIDEVLRESVNQKETNKNVIEFAVLFISLFGTIFLLYSLLDIELLILIPLTIIVWTIVYFIGKGRMNHFYADVKTHMQHKITQQSYQLSVMLGAGMLIFSLNQTAFAQTVVDGIYTLQEMVPFLNLLYFLPFIIIVLGFFGLGPLTVLVLVGGILGSIHLPYEPELIVLAVTSGSAISILLSPLIMPIITLSGSNGLSGFTNGIRFNWKYALALYMVVQIYVQTRVYIG
ncbi:hypothetical protein [Virgibacillus sp. YIM 98842]|uniref:hypothetical protein n=1 Tax=Virgibacillus sp. YIM 98842 TaxID=2663533 RepID=UPI0013DCA835|nr:hypothetical protein [Virgibacillus sp. YIM 98842]